MSGKSISRINKDGRCGLLLTNSSKCGNRNKSDSAKHIKNSTDTSFRVVIFAVCLSKNFDHNLASLGLFTALESS